MEKIIYNTKLKKIFIATLIVMLMTYVFMPIAFAAVISFDPRQFILDNGGIPENADEIYNWDYEVWKIDDSEKRLLLNNYVKSGAFTVASVEYVAFEQGIAQYNTKLAEKKDSSLGEALDYATGEAADRGDEVLEEAGKDVVDENGEDAADLGGILLSPIFYLVNYIADAITSNLGRIMNGEGLSITSGTKVLQKSAIPATSTGNFHEIKTDSFGIIQYPNITYTPEEIFSGKIDLLSIDFISGKNYEGNANTDEDWLNIRSVISQWYQVLRMVAIIGLLSVLIYTGIKIIISANAKDKAKYKEWIINWFMAVAILFAMHFIMAFIIAITGELSKLITEVSGVINVQPTTGEAFSTNLMGLVRFMIQSENFAIKVGYEVMYIALIVYTIKFTVVYLKRVLNMAFLTLIAPIVALTYPIDKINDGRAQGFDMWLKEYIFNALLQPMHCILYYVLVGSSVSIAASNPIYGIVVLMFMTEAEKLLKKIFGFDKAGGGTVGGMANAFAAGAIASSISKMMKLPKGNAGKGGSGNAGIDNNLLNNPKPINKDGGDELFDNDDSGLLPTMDNNNHTQPEQEEQDYTDQPEANFYRQQRQDRLDMGMSEEEIDREMMDSYGATGRDEMSYQNDSSNQSDDDFYRQQRQDRLDMGMPEEEVDREMMDSYGTTGRAEIEATNAQEKLTNNQTNQEKTTKPIHKFARGMNAVGKRLAKPVWDADQNAEYNFKRMAKGAGRAALGVGLGTAAAAVQAGISITDGKYNPLEGAASFTAGYAGGGQVARGLGSLYDTYQEGTLSDDPKERNKEIMKKAQERWPEREDVKKYNKKYKEEDRANVIEIQKDLLSQGITSTKEMDSCIKYIKESNGGSLDNVSANMIKKSRVLHDFNEELTSHGMQRAPYDADLEKKYIDTKTKGLTGDDKTALERQLRNKFVELRKYHEANKP